MCTQKLRKQTKYLGLLIDKLNTEKMRLFDIKHTIKREDEKDNIESYLLTPRSWYVLEQEKSEAQIERIKNRINNCLDNINQLKLK